MLITRQEKQPLHRPADETKDALGLYIHIPFCEKKCPYCDFNTYAGLESLFDRTVDALCAEMARWQATLAGQAITTIFLGGGTPTVLDAPQLTRLIEHIHRTFTIANGCEFTSEANPGTVDRSKFALLRSLGVNRISLGVQSFQADELRFLGRIHDVDDVYRAFAAARNAGFDNINLDFMFGLPDQSAAAWEATLAKALTLQPDHLSLYSLIVEPDTPLHHWVQIGQAAEPDEDMAALHYEMAMAQLADAGYRQYEVSNWARAAVPAGPASAASARRSAEATSPLLACRHNLIYWRNQPYLGIGPGAHSHLMPAGDVPAGDVPAGDVPAGDVPAGDVPAGDVPAGDADAGSHQSDERRWGNHKPVAGYVRRIQTGEPVAAFSETIDPRLSMAETMMLGLRLIDEGVGYARFAERYQQSLFDAFGAEIAELDAWGMLDIGPDRLRLSPRGLMVGNQVFAHFLPDRE